MSTPFQDFKTFCNKVGLDFQWANTQSPKPTPETNPSEIPSAVNETRQERPKDSVNCVFTDIKNAQLWNVFKKVGVNTLSTEPARSNMSETNASKTDCAIHNDFAMMDASPPTPSAVGQNENSGPSSTHGSDATAPSTAASVSTNHEPVPSLASSVSTSSSVYSSWDPLILHLHHLSLLLLLPPLLLPHTTIPRTAGQNRQTNTLFYLTFPA